MLKCVCKCKIQKGTTHQTRETDTHLFLPSPNIPSKWIIIKSNTVLIRRGTLTP